MIRVEYDATDVRRAMGDLEAGMDRQTRSVPAREATNTAAAIRAGVPKRTGRLAATVRTVTDSEGSGVTYGGGLPYARYIEGRSHAVERGVAAGGPRFVTAMTRAGEQEVRAI